MDIKPTSFSGGLATKWQLRFMQLAFFWAQYHTCDRADMGAVIVRDKRVIASGYNGAPSGCDTCDDVGHAMFHGHCKRTVHAEANAIAQAARLGQSIEGCDIYITSFPCWDCAKLITASGIKRVYYARDYYQGTHPIEEWELLKSLYEGLGVEFIKLTDVTPQFNRG